MSGIGRAASNAFFWWHEENNFYTHSFSEELRKHVTLHCLSPWRLEIQRDPGTHAETQRPVSCPDYPTPKNTQELNQKQLEKNTNSTRISLCASDNKKNNHLCTVHTHLNPCAVVVIHQWPLQAHGWHYSSTDTDGTVIHDKKCFSVISLFSSSARYPHSAAFR